MDCRKCLVLALGLLTLAGCTRHLTTGLQDEPVAQNDAPALMGSPFRPGNDNPKRAFRPATYVARGEFLMSEASLQEPGSPNLEKQREQARQSFLQALRADPNYLPAHVALARYYATTDEVERAVASYRKVLEIEPNNHPIWYELGMCQARKKDWTNALASLGKAVALDKENRQYNNMLGFTLARMGHYDQSLACFAKVQGEAMAHYNLARMLEHLKQPDLCKKHLQLALAKMPDFAPAQSLLAQLNAPAKPAASAGLPEPASAIPQAVSQAVGQPAPAVPVQPVSYNYPASSPTTEAQPAGAPGMLKISEVTTSLVPASNPVILPSVPARVQVSPVSSSNPVTSPTAEAQPPGAPADLMIIGVTCIPLTPTHFTPLVHVDKKAE